MTKSEFHARNLEIVQLRKEGLTFQQLSDKFKISRQRVFQICKKSKFNQKEDNT